MILPHPDGPAKPVPPHAHTDRDIVTEAELLSAGWPAKEIAQLPSAHGSLTDQYWPAEDVTAWLGAEGLYP